MVFAIYRGPAICDGSTGWPQPSSVCGSCCSAATWPSPQKCLPVLHPGPPPFWNHHSRKIRSWFCRVSGLHSPWAFWVSRYYWNLQPCPSYSTPCCDDWTTVCYTGWDSQHTLHASYIWFHSVRAPIHHVCSQPSLTQASATCMWKHSLCWHSWVAKIQDECLCQGFPRWRDLALLKPFQSMFAREVSINSSFWHVPGLQLRSTIFSQLRIFLAGKGHHLLLPKQSQQSQCEYCCCHGLCDYSWVLRSSNSCKTMIQG